MKNRRISRFLAVLLFMALLFTAIPADVIAADSYPAKEEIAEEYSRYILNSEGINSTVYDETPITASPYSAGAVSQQTLTYALDTLNFIRYVAHLPEVGLDSAYTAYSQHAAVLLDSIKALNHTPSKPSDMSDEFYNLAYTGTSKGNLSSGYSTLSAALLGQMADSSSTANLLSMGHRRWLLNPTMGYTGFGISGRYYAVYAFDRSASAPDYDFIAWPASGNQPLEYFTASTPWSVTLNPNKYTAPSAGDIEVTITRQSDGKTWTLSQKNYSDSPSTYTGYFTVNNNGYGVSNCIIFHPGTSNLGETGLSGAFTVTISGLKTRAGGGQSTSLTYTADFFNLLNTVTFNSNGGSLVSGQEVIYGNSAIEPAAPTRTGFTFDGWYTDTDLAHAYSFNSAVTGNIILYAKWTANTYTVTFETNGGTEISPITGAAGTVIDLSEYSTELASHIFDGWYTDPELTNRVTSITLSDNITLYAKLDFYCILWESYDAYIGGYSDGTVKPNAKITREEVAQIFYNLMSYEARSYLETSTNSFSDVASDRWSNTPVSTLANAGILSGYSDSTFMPGKEITRAEFVKIAASFMGLKNVNTPEYPFSDISEHWALKYILHAENEGWISGYSDGAFRPDQSITRAEAIKITNALSGREAGHIDRIENMKTWLDNTDESAWYYADIQIATNSYDMTPR